MDYGDLQFFDIIVFAGVAAFLIYRLRNVLGKRSGFEKKIGKPQPKEKEINSLKNIPQLKDNENKLSKAYEVLVDFDHKKFLEGAKFAFETIINAFNNNDKKTLKNLLTKNVFLTFENAIDEKKNNPNYQFYSIIVDEVTDVSVIDSLINITLKITSEQFKDNDESTISKKQDTWTFQKKINSNSPIWLLSST
ncbi:Tim44/TimA family putative adaptor protein [Alphaproteobacteria bacterium]|nr:Tim44/TimA family putative adaptor protein [Alphaproteobacteria bacterium]